MTNVSYPGVYVEEIAGGARPIEAAGTSTAAFVGMAEKGPDSAAIRISSWDEYQRTFGGFVADGYLAESVYAFFNNGGRQCYIVRVTRSDAAAADVTVNNRAGTPVAGLQFVALNKGAWANSIVLTIEDGSNDPGNEFKLTLRQQPDPSLVPSNLVDIAPLEVHDNLAMNPDAANYFKTVLVRDSKILEGRVLGANVTLQAGFHLGGTLAALPVPDADHCKFQISIDGDSFQEVTLAVPAAPGSYTWTNLKDDIQAKVRLLTPKRNSVPAAAFAGFTCEAVPAGTPSQLLLTSGSSSSTASAVQVQNAASKNTAVLLRLGRGNGGSDANAFSLRRPVNAGAIQLGDAAVAGPVPTSPTLGTNGSQTLTEQNFANAFTMLDGKTDVSILSVPGIGTSTMMDLGTAYCQNRPLQDMFYVGEVGQFDDQTAEGEAFRKNLTKANSYGALYFPWLLALDPSGRSPKPVRLPPAGYIAGLYARIDGTRGVWKAPAGTEASLNGVVGLAGELTDTEQGNLNPISVNVIRRFALSGIVSWGARTVAADPEYKYVPVRRTAIMMRRSIYDGIQWAVFEPNDDKLWSALRLNIGSFMNGLFRAGAFQGSKASDAYFVRCGLGDTMIQDDIDRGQVIVLVGFAPVKPAEFVIVRIQQKVGQQ